MFSLKIVRWLLGYAKFSVRGGSPERFYNYCTRRGICLWNILGRRQGGACVAARSYRTLRLCARKAGCKLAVCEKHGLPFLMLRTKKHRGLFAGAAVFIVILYLLSVRIWCVQVTGNSQIKTAEIESALKSEGLYSGALKKGADPGLIEQKIMLKFPQIGWMSVNTQGCIAEICLEEKTDSPDIVPKDKICNIKASATGQILSAQVYAGTLLVKKGDAVVQGQLLVSAVVEDSFGGSTLKHAAAEITAETSRTFTAEINLKQRKSEPTGKIVTRRNLDFFGARLPLSFEKKPCGEYRVTAQRTGVKMFGTLLPVGIYEERWTETRGEDFVLTKEQAHAEAGRKLEEMERNELRGVKVVSVDADETVKDGKLIYTAKLKCEENIAEESEIFIKN